MRARVNKYCFNNHLIIIITFLLNKLSRLCCEGNIILYIYIVILYNIFHVFFFYYIFIYFDILKEVAF